MKNPLPTQDELDAYNEFCRRIGLVRMRIENLANQHWDGPLFQRSDEKELIGEKYVDMMFDALQRLREHAEVFLKCDHFLSIRLHSILVQILGELFGGGLMGYRAHEREQFQTYEELMRLSLKLERGFWQMDSPERHFYDFDLDSVQNRWKFVQDTYMGPLLICVGEVKTTLLRSGEHVSTPFPEHTDPRLDPELTPTERWVVKFVVAENESGRHPTQPAIILASKSDFDDGEVEGISVDTLKHIMPRLCDRYGFLNARKRGYYHPGYFKYPDTD